MSATYRIEGLHCSHCVGRVQKALDAKGYQAKVTLDPPQVEVKGAAPAQGELASVVASAGDYKLGQPVAATGGGLLSKFRAALGR